MDHWTKVGAIAAAVGIGVGSGAAWAHQRVELPVIEPGPATRALGNDVSEAKFIPISPCRLVDTRKGTPSPAVGVGRPVAVRGSGPVFAAQGGQPNGCKIPFGARAIEATITAVDPPGKGYLRAYPVTETLATFLNYKGASNTNSGAVALCAIGCVANHDLHYRLFSSGTDVVIDVQGYYSPPMGALIDGADGSVIGGTSSRVLASTRTGVGTYEITFDRDVNDCLYSATPIEPGRVVLAKNVGFTQAEVHTANTNDALVDSSFQIEAIC